MCAWARAGVAEGKQGAAARRMKLFGYQVILLLPICLKPALDMPLRRTHNDFLARMVCNADPGKTAYRKRVSLILKNTLLFIQQQSYCDLSSHQSSRHQVASYINTYRALTLQGPLKSILSLLSSLKFFFFLLQQLCTDRYSQRWQLFLCK